MTIDIVTIFPGVFAGPFDESIVGRAVEKGLLRINVVDLREFAFDKRRRVDDKPYGGGPGMLMMCEPLFRAVESLRAEKSKVILMTPQGEVFRQSIAEGLSVESHLVIICGHYEGVDERVRLDLVDMEISIGDFILTNGNLPAMVLTEAVARLVPGVLGSAKSCESDSFSNGMLEYPQYTRPENFRGQKVPEVLLSGDHGQIRAWRESEALKRTTRRRPDLLGAGEK
ncbi:MAG: tRNA (guanosine(37)-N1)-methyltransferase TrmD [Victivallales bacterium]|nr:tRNA (guanosine(37)-N1)-methyltransferase TrmD [Victivallales bacterium]